MGAGLNNFTASNPSFRGLRGRLLFVLAFLACLSLHAEDSEKHDGLNTNQNKLQSQNKYAAISKSNYVDIINIAEDAQIYIADDNQIYTSEQSHAKPANPVKTGKKTAVIKEEKSEPAENKITEQKPTTVVLLVFPFESSSSSFLLVIRESAAITPQQRINEYQQAAKTYPENSYKGIYNPDLSLYYPEQRQKLSIAATQCGMMTSFGSTSPPIL